MICVPVLFQAYGNRVLAVLFRTLVLKSTEENVYVPLLQHFLSHAMNAAFDYFQTYLSESVQIFQVLIISHD
jgi:hypothetical protein